MAAGDVVIARDFLVGKSRGAKAGKPRFIYGTVQLDGSNPTPVTLTSYLSAVDAGGVSLEGSVAPGDDPVVVTSGISAAVLNVYAWKHTTGGAAGNPTLIASTDNARLVNWWAVGPSL